MTEHSIELHAERLKRLSDELGRLTQAMARLALPANDAPIVDLSDDVPDVPVERVRAVISARRARVRHFPEDLFADPAWDILLDLLQSEIAGQRVSVSSACLAAAVPSTTGLRWIKSLVERGLIARKNDPLDGRRVFVELTPATRRAMRLYFANTDKAEAS